MKLTLALASARKRLPPKVILSAALRSRRTSAYFFQRVADYYVYILTNKTRSTLYIGVTNNLDRRISEHRLQHVKGFSAQYNLRHLLYYENYPDPRSAIEREKQLKGWRREKKVGLIEQKNPRWMDLSEDWFENRR